MANTYHQVYIQTVFAVKYRQALIAKPWSTQLFAVIGNLINETGCKNILVNGVSDHVHCFFSLKPALAISEVMKTVKAKSSKFINDHHLTPHRFEWQEGYGAFSYSQSQINDVYQYVLAQEAHHQKHAFRSEYRELLDRFQITYEEAYLFHEPE